MLPRPASSSTVFLDDVVVLSHTTAYSTCRPAMWGHVGPCGADCKIRMRHIDPYFISLISYIWWYLFSRTVVWIRMVTSQEPQINFNHWGSRDSDTKLLYMLAESYGTSLSHSKPKCWFPVIFSRLLLGSCLACREDSDSDSSICLIPMSCAYSAWFTTCHRFHCFYSKLCETSNLANFRGILSWLPIPLAKSQLFPPDRKATNPHRAELDPRRPKGET